MAETQFFDLGRVLSNAETIKGMRRQSVTDQLQEQFLRTRNDAAQFDLQTARNKQQQDNDVRTHRTVYAKSQAILSAQDPKAMVAALAPELIQQHEAQYGQGSWNAVTPEQVKADAERYGAIAFSQLGLTPQEQMQRDQMRQQQSQFDARLKQDQSQFEESRNISPYQQAQLDLDRDRISAASANKSRDDERSALKTEQGLRKEFRSLPSVKSYESALPIVESAKTAPDTPAGDLQIVYSVGKALDPDSVVREGELQLTQNATPFLQKVVGKARAEIQGKGRLTPATRRDLIEMLDQRMSGYKQAYDRDYQQYSQYARESGVDPSRIVGTMADSAYGQQGEAIQVNGFTIRRVR
jgi:hypothetical protein